MTKKIFIAFLFFIANSYTSEAKTIEPKKIEYRDKNIELLIEIKEMKKIKKQSWEKGDEYKYFYHGIMTSVLISNNPPQVIKVIYKNEESEIYPDTIASIINFWDRNSWDEKGYRKNKVYIVLSNENSNIDWNALQIKTIHIIK